MTAQTSTAPQPQYHRYVLTDSPRAETVKSVFTPDTPEIFIFFDLQNAPPGTPVKAVWIAERVEGVPPGYEMDTFAMETSAAADSYSFSYTRPTRGWPLGEYGIKLYLDGEYADTVRFRVARQRPVPTLVDLRKRSFGAGAVVGIAVGLALFFWAALPWWRALVAGMVAFVGGFAAVALLYVVRGMRRFKAEWEEAREQALHHLEAREAERRDEERGRS